LNQANKQGKEREGLQVYLNLVSCCDMN